MRITFNLERTTSPVNTRENPVKVPLCINGISLQKYCNLIACRVWRSTTLNTSKDEVFITQNYKQFCHQRPGHAKSIFSLTNLTNFRNLGTA